MTPGQSFTVPPDAAGTRLDVFLTGKLPGTTRSRIQKLIKNGAVEVNTKPASVHQFLKTGDIVMMAQETRSKGSTQPASPTPAAPKIVYEDDNVLVLDKPAGLLVHPTPHERDGTLTDWLVEHYPPIRTVGADPLRPGIVHRLDRDVSGLMMVAKTPAAYAHLVGQFTDQRVGKTYAAVVYGAPTKVNGEITLPIGRATDGSYVARPAPDAKPDDRPATTDYRLVRTTGPYSLLEVEIATGRPHQIRAHLAAIGLPIVGDTEYGPRKPFHHTGTRRIKTVTLDRLLLHVTKLRFTGPDGTPHAFSSPLPEIFSAYAPAHE
ncbi:MAG: 23S rRNA pseudouridine synthase [Parcubacteria group bacterium Gr01-1014_31]|nr:MAG: 23S rRNA pseudouridine synthase [Parcubacteria group bacterium Gr01-1014_31]